MRRVLGFIALAFVIFYILTQPVNSANAVRGAGSMLQNAASALATFLQSIF